MNKTLQAKETISKHISRQRMARQFRLPAERVLAEQLGYSRATIGKALGVLEGEGVILRKKGSGTFIAETGKERTMTIALVMRTAYHYTDVHFRLIVEEVSKYAEKNNIYIQIFDRLPDMFKSSSEENPLIQGIKNGIIDGVLIASRMPLSILAQINAVCPAVSINNVFGEGSEMPCISCDYFLAGSLAGKHLLKNGHRNVAYVTEELTSPESTFEFSGFKAALDMFGINISKQDVLETKQNMNIFNKRVIDFFMNSNYTACFVRNSYFAARMISVLGKKGIAVPADLSVISTGNYSNSFQNKKRMTVIDNKLIEMCDIGLKTLQAIIKSNRIEGGLKLLNPKIIKNDSVINLNKIK